jgi:hypothetical protein
MRRWAALYINLITTLSGFAHFEDAIEEASQECQKCGAVCAQGFTACPACRSVFEDNGNPLMCNFHPLESVVRRLRRMRHYGFVYEPEDRQRPAEEFVLGDRATGGVQEFPMHLVMLRDTKAFGWRVPLPAAGEVLLSVKDGDVYQYQLTSLRYDYSAWEYFAVCLLNMQKALRAGPDADHITTEQVRCEAHMPTTSLTTIDHC